MHPLQGRPGAHREVVRLIGVALVVAGCGGDPYREFQSARNQITCEALFRCCTPDEAEKKDPMQRDAASCRAALDGRITGSISTGISKGALTFDAGAAKRCLDALRADRASCDGKHDASAGSADCAVVVTGTAATGATCLTDLDCAAADRCEATVAATGICRSRVKSGQPCVSTATCALGLVCRPKPSATCGAVLDEYAVCESGAQCRGGACARPCEVTGADMKGNAIVENRFCRDGCDRFGACLVPGLCVSDPMRGIFNQCAGTGVGCAGPMKLCPSLDLRCAPARTVREAVCR